MYLFFRRLLSWYFHLKYKIRVYGKENIPKYKKGQSYITAANHQDYLDPPLLSSIIKGRFSFMAKAELFEEKKWFSILITMLGAFPVHRGKNDSSAINRAVSDIEKGKILIIFPEGQRSKDGKIKRARTGTSLIAARAGKDILPVCIMYRRNKKGKINGMDLFFGKMMSASELGFSSDNQPDFPALKNFSKKIFEELNLLQSKILEKSGITLEEYSDKRSL